jgi:DNA-binding response OmpR family regulator
MRKSKRASSQRDFSILTLDDDPIMTSTLQAFFQRSGYQVDVEHEPYKAIERIREGHYDILLLDFLMTPICGDQVVWEIRKFNRDIFIILLTGHKSVAPPIKTIRDLDIQGYYEKSDRFDQLELLVESCVKSILQMRTIRSYQNGLSAIMDSLPQIYHLQSLEHIIDSILHPASLQQINTRIAQLSKEHRDLVQKREQLQKSTTPTAETEQQIDKLAKTLTSLKHSFPMLSVYEKRIFIKQLVQKITWNGTDLHIFIGSK